VGRVGRRSGLQTAPPVPIRPPLVGEGGPPHLFRTPPRGDSRAGLSSAAIS